MSFAHSTIFVPSTISRNSFELLKERHAEEISTYLINAEKEASEIQERANEIMARKKILPAQALKEVVNRHGVPETNWSAWFLSSLEEKFKENKEELEKIRDIVILDENHIRIAWFTHKFWIATAPEDEDNGIIVNHQWTLFTHEAAMKFVESQVGYCTYSETELETLLKAIPGNSTGQQAQITLKLLKLPLAWYRSGYCGKGSKVFWSINSDVTLWTTTTSPNGANHFTISKVNRVAHNQGFTGLGNAHSLVLRKV